MISSHSITRFSFLYFAIFLLTSQSDLPFLIRCSLRTYVVLFRAVDDTLGQISSSKAALHFLHQSKLANEKEKEFVAEKEKEKENEKEKEKKVSETLDGKILFPSSSPAQKLRKSVLKTDSSNYENIPGSGSRGSIGAGAGAGAGPGVRVFTPESTPNYYSKRKDRSRGESFSQQV